MRDRTLIRAVVVCAFAASTAAHSSPSAADGHRFRREDVPLPPGTVSAIPIAGSEAGDIVGLAWDGAGNPSVWLRLADCGFGIPAGWVLLGNPAAGARSRPVVVSPDCTFMAASARNAITSPSMIIESRASTAWHSHRSVSDGGAVVDIRGVSNDGNALGFASPSSPLAGWQLAWLDVSGMQRIEPPSTDCAALLPASITTGRRAVAVADFGDERPPRATLVAHGHARFLDELADGEFPWASSIRQNGTVTAAVLCPGGRFAICQLIDTGVDGNEDGKVSLEDFPVFLERYASSSDLCDVNLSGDIEASDLFQWIDVVSDSEPLGLGARALELVGGASRVVSASAFPTAVVNAAAAQTSYLGEGEVRYGFAQSHTPDCIDHVVSTMPACAAVWDAACEALASEFYAEAVARSGLRSQGCIEAACAVDPVCCDSWDGNCDAVATVVCPFLPPGQGCAFTQPWPYDASKPASWSYCGAVGGISFESICFNHCCADHDMCYSTCGAYGSDPSEANPFDACNQRFLDCMLSSCAANANPTDPLHSWCGSSKTCKRRALAYFLAVQWFSDPAWCACCAAVTPERCGLQGLPLPIPDGDGHGSGWWRYLRPLLPILVPGPIAAPNR